MLHRPNGGLSAARNSGLDLASGEWVTFVDSDDWIHEDTLQGYVELFEQHPELDLIESAYYSSTSHGTTQLGDLAPDAELDGRIIGQRELYQRFTLQVGTSTQPLAWNKCFRRQLIGQQRFREGRVFEDLEFMLRLYGRVSHYMRWPRITYYYRENRPGSITERDETLLIPKFVDSYENMKEVLLDLEQTRAHNGDLRPPFIPLSEQITYVASRFITDLLVPPYGDKHLRKVRDLLYVVQKPYIRFLKDYPYQSPYRDRLREQKLATWSYWFYMKVYLPLHYLYLRLRYGAPS